MVKGKKTVKKSKTPTKKASKGFLAGLFGEKKTKSSSKKRSASLKTVAKKAPAKKKTTSPKTTKPKTSKQVTGSKIVPIAPVKKGPISSPKPLKVEPPKKFVVESSYTPEPFKGSSFLLKPGKILTAEGWNRFFETEHN